MAGMRPFKQRQGRSDRLMSRVINLAMEADAVVKHCGKKSIDISVIEALPEGGVRLVCSSMDGAKLARVALRRHVMKGDPRREKFVGRRPSL